MTLFLVPNSGGEPERDSVGEADSHFREAASTLSQDKSYEAQMEKVRTACMKEFSESGNNATGCGYDSMGQSAYVERTFDDSVVFKKNGKLYAADWSENDDGEIEFGEAEEVRPTYTKVQGKKLKEARR
jgi:hypothetical protein